MSHRSKKISFRVSVEILTQLDALVSAANSGKKYWVGNISRADILAQLITKGYIQEFGKSEKK